jgi:catechol 2,3-dioxygenase-like lactoylglutathione lyase family enzyme
MRILIVLAFVFGCGRSHDEQHGLAVVTQQCMAKDLGCPRPILYVSKIQKSIAYYRDRLGFRFDWIDEGDFASVTRGDAQIFMCEKCQGHAGSWIWVTTPDVDALYAELKKRGAIIKSAPENKRWGVREMNVADPDDNVLRIAGPTR